MANYWIKLYQDILRDPKMGRLSDSAFRRCIELFLLAGEQPERDGTLPAIDDIAWELRVSNETLSRDLTELEKCQIVSISGDRVTVCNFLKRQAAIDSTERSRRSREAEKLQRNVADVATSATKSKDRNTWMTEIYRSLPDKPGIYSIEFLSNGRVYVGASVSIRNRIKSHLSEMSATPNHAMSDDFRLYGPHNLRVSVLEEVQDTSALKEKESYWIGQYPGDDLYNNQAFGKRHRDWDAVATLRRTETETETETDKEPPNPQRGNGGVFNPSPVKSILKPEAEMRTEAILAACSLRGNIPAHRAKAESAAAQLPTFQANFISRRYTRPGSDWPPSEWNWYIDDFRGRDEGKCPIPQWIVDTISLPKPTEGVKQHASGKHHSAKSNAQPYTPNKPEHAEYLAQVAAYEAAKRAKQQPASTA